MKSKKIAIVGSGIAGLASAIRLASKGHKVYIFEANSYPGGKLTSFKQGAYRFDAGPSLFTLPELLEECLSCTGKNPKEYFEYIEIEKACNYFFGDGSNLTAYTDKTRFAKEVENKLGTSRELVKEHLEESQFIYEKTNELFMHRSLHKLKNYFKKDVLDALLHVNKFHLNQSMHEVNAARFKDPRLVQLFDRFATYNGSNPYKAPGVLNIIPHLEHNIGTYFPKSGMHSITKALVKASADLGVKILYDHKVDEICIKDKKVSGLFSNGEFHSFEIVISNADVYPTYRNLLPKEKAPEKILKQERSSSALIFYWGINSTFPELDLHNILFSGDYEKEFKHLFGERNIIDDPTVYINISSKYNSDDAPINGENWFVMVNAPSNIGQDWDSIISETRQNVISKINKTLSIDLETYIVNESILDPRSIEAKTSSYQGSLYGTSSNTKFSAFLRHPNFTQKIKNLYFCGGSVHPGGGIPLCLLSAKIVAELIE